MFDWLFKPKCPCDPAAKAWIEYRLRWLSEEFSEGAFSGGPIIIPTRRFFPETFDGSDDAVRKVMDRVCDYMDVNPRAIDLQFVQNANALRLVNESETKPSWAKFLSRFARLELDQGIRYLRQTRDSSYLPRAGELLN